MQREVHLPESLRQRVAQKRLFFTVTTGRSGTDYLAKLVNRMPGVRGRHEPSPNFVEVMRRVQTDPDLARRYWLELKLPNIADRAEGIYVETSHVFCKGFLEPLLDLGFVPDLLLISRAPRQVAMSMCRLGTVPGRTVKGDHWYLRPDDPGVLPLPGWEGMHDYQLCYWYCLEIARRQHLYAELIASYGGRSLELTLSELKTQRGVAELARFLTGRDLAWTSRLGTWLDQRKRHNVKHKAKRAASVDTPRDLDAMEREVHERTV